ncbi:3-phosphoshikimate 1-carboxyvinyltransferase [Methanobacterium formicicum]|uniref:3-phosphoshikimate 1-carboxyvinyltransferase n=1 Tax=Methanobacterium formicicum (strain DSM 3637 / PP1) TaxID=1204725 RepID=K2R5D0_METFP|nr:3-phosphoshikimate 1-carboxyvinyltransferase [Methanobacterium formicicum]EKF86402.1 3-phosphoshikimate 1-carboxyvinyltransferase [Methanobacterium formicicum DSM 3637]
MELKVEKASKIKGVVKAPPSKSYTHRALLVACLAEGESCLRDPLYSADTLATLEACQAMGCEIEIQDDLCTVTGTGGDLKTPQNVLDLKNSGTTLRFLTTMASLAPGCTVLTGDDSLRGRPMQDLLNSLKTLGVKAYSTQENGLPPMVIKNGFYGGKTQIKGDVSSQYISSILLSAPYAQNSVDLSVVGEFKSKPYVEMTLDIMEKFGVHCQQDPGNKFHLDKQTYNARDYTIEGDYSSASYLLSAAAILDGEVTVQNLFSESKQGDKIILDILQEMGARIIIKEDQVTVKGTLSSSDKPLSNNESLTSDKILSNAESLSSDKLSSNAKLSSSDDQTKTTKSTCDLNGINVNLENSPDLLPTVAALAAVAQGTSHITGVEHARFKETDRVHTMALELTKLGVDVTEEQDGLIIKGGAHGGVVKSHDDHRLVMALTLVGLLTGGVHIKGAAAHRVSFPNFPQVMEGLGCPIKII